MAKINQSKCKQDRSLEHTTQKYSTSVPSFFFIFLTSATAVFDASANVFVCFHSGKHLELDDETFSCCSRHIARLFKATITAAGVCFDLPKYAFEGDETRHINHCET